VSLIFDLFNNGVKSLEQVTTINDTDFQESDEGLASAAHGAMRQKILSALDNELESFDEVVICLSHLYPVCQADPNTLKGGDAALYNLLLKADAYDLSVIPITVTRTEDERYPEANDVSGSVLALSTTWDGKRTTETELVIPINVTSNEILEHTPYIDHVGNESQAEETLYLVTGLQVTKRVAEATRDPDPEVLE
jgi:hypothetical protein